MRNLKVVGPVLRLASGRVKLTPAQSQDRLPALTEIGKGVFEVVKPIEFKRGEVIEYDGVLPKGVTAELVEEVRRARVEALV